MAFLKKFSLIIAALVLLTLVLIAFAHYLHGTVPPEVSPLAEARLQQRLQPAGAVYAGDTGAAAMAAAAEAARSATASQRSEEHTSELQSLMRISYAVFCLKKKNKIKLNTYKSM